MRLKALGPLMRDALCSGSSSSPIAKQWSKDFHSAAFIFDRRKVGCSQLGYECWSQPPKKPLFLSLMAPHIPPPDMRYGHKLCHTHGDVVLMDFGYFRSASNEIQVKPSWLPLPSSSE